jgi:hypothetical protein
MGQIFLKEGIVERNTAAADSAIIPCKKVWHKSDMKKGRIQASGIDTDARWDSQKLDGCLDTNCTCHVPLEGWQFH